MENLKDLSKEELVDRLVECTQIFTEAYLLGKKREELLEYRNRIEELQKEIIARSAHKGN